MLNLDDKCWFELEADSPEDLREVLDILESGELGKMFLPDFLDIIQTLGGGKLLFALLPHVVKIIPLQSVETRVILLNLIGKVAREGCEDCPREYLQDLLVAFENSYELSFSLLFDSEFKKLSTNHLLSLLGTLLAFRGQSAMAYQLLRRIYNGAEIELTDIQGRCPHCDSIWCFDL